MKKDISLGYLQPPSEGKQITIGKNGTLIVPSNPVIPYIEGDGIGRDITPAAQRVVDAAIAKSYDNKKKIFWYEVYAGQKCYNKFKSEERLTEKEKWLLPDTLRAFEKYKVGIKGPLTTPVGEGFRSLNVAIRQKMDLYVCLRPVRWYGSPSPVKEPNLVDMVIFRENSEDIYAGVEYKEGTKECEKVLNFLKKDMGVKKIRFPKTSGLGIKPISREGSERLIRRAIQYALKHNRKSVTLVHKGNIMKFTEGAFMNWGYELAKREFDATEIDGGPWCVIKNSKTKNDLIIKDFIADAFLQQILLRPASYDVIATMNLNGDYISDALAAMVGGIGIAPGANLRDDVAIFEATHGTAPKYTDLDKVNPGSLILSAQMLLRHIGWIDAADLIVRAMEETIREKTVTYDLARLMDGAKEVKCSEFAEAIIDNM